MKSRLYKKFMKNFSRYTWITIIKNDNNFCEQIKLEFWELFSETNVFFVTNEFIKLEKKRTQRNSTLQNAINNTKFQINQEFEFAKTFVLMIKLMSYKIMYVIVVVNDWEIEQMNVKTTFLYEKIEKDVYVVQSIDFEQDVNQICKLNKAL